MRHTRAFASAAILLHLAALAACAAAEPGVPAGRPCPGNPVSIAELDVLRVFGLLAIHRERGATNAELLKYSRNFDRSDTDKDGRHSRTEYIEKGRHMNPTARRGIFGAADNNADGFVTRIEYLLNRCITDEAKAMIQPADTNKDGQVSRDELMHHLEQLEPELAGALFDALDTNGDGVTTIPEYLRAWGGWARPHYLNQEACLAERVEGLELGN